MQSILSTLFAAPTIHYSLFTMTILSSEILADLRSAGWLEGELHPELDRHRRHEIADICELDNVERVWRVLAVCEAQVRLALSRLLHPLPKTPEANLLLRPTKWDFRFRFAVSTAVGGFLREKIHEYMVAAVMADRCSTIIPSAAASWVSRRDAALAALQNVAATTRLPTGPARRPLFPF